MSWYDFEFIFSFRVHILSLYIVVASSLHYTYEMYSSLPIGSLFLKEEKEKGIERFCRIFKNFIFSRYSPTHQHRLRHVDLRRKRLHKPFGFHSIYILAITLSGFLRVYPAHYHFRCQISIGMGYCFVKRSRFELEIWFCQNIFIIRLSQL